MHHGNTVRIRQLQHENARLSALFTADLTALSEARTLLLSLPESTPATIDSTLSPSPPPLLIVDKIPYQEILDYASKISKYTSPDPHWDPTRPQQPGIPQFVEVADVRNVRPLAKRRCPPPRPLSTISRRRSSPNRHRSRSRRRTNCPAPQPRTTSRQRRSTETENESGRVTKRGYPGV